MSITNHAAVAAILALTIKNPVVVIPLVLISHYVLDAFPHFGYAGGGGFGEAFKHRLTYFYIGLDVLGSIIVIWSIWATAWLVYISALTAVIPDMGHIYRYFFKERKGLSKPGEGNLLSSFHHKIEWCERPWGLYVEVPIAVFLLLLIWNIK